ncbi:MAG: hypothetical protein QE290_06990 [Acidovorax sp.]|jgi:hypothetical protein|uniref:hypothetical protein n=1 Tax=Acidovorax sp. TaxID=1872122 RepID=UPI0026084FC5|nr:hypothetical protein [Acidovorax sp.]MDH4463766.1 hypothetical protein [Acidovorax sp.]
MEIDRCNILCRCAALSATPVLIAVMFPSMRFTLKGFIIFTEQKYGLLLELLI